MIIKIIIDEIPRPRPHRAFLRPVISPLFFIAYKAIEPMTIAINAEASPIKPLENTIARMPKTKDVIANFFIGTQHLLY